MPAFWNAEGVTLQRKGLPVREFKIDDYGAPPWPEVVLATTRTTLDDDRDTLRRFVAAVQDGARAELSDPAAAAQDIAKASDAKDLGLVRAQLAAVRPILDPKLRLNRAGARALGGLRRPDRPARRTAGRRQDVRLHAGAVARKSRAVATSTSRTRWTDARSTHSSSAWAPPPAGPNRTAGTPASVSNAESAQ